MDVQHEVRRVTDSLAARHPLFATQTVERLVARLFAELADSKVTLYLPVLVERAADARLRDLDGSYTGERAPAPFVRAPDAEAALSA